MDIRQQWFGLLISSQVIFPGKVSADWNSQAIFPIYVEEEDKELFGLATNFNSFSGSTKVTQLHCQFGTRKYLSSQVEIT